VLADVEAGVVAVAHVGRPGVVAGIVSEAVAAARAHGARDVEAWVGPHVCGGCYEVPAAMRDDVSSVEPAAFCCTTWGTPSVDIGAAVVAQLRAAGCRQVNELTLCTRESEDLYSHRRQGAASGRLGGLVVLRDGDE
jgi:copper oxidase (laccase) domain-containing protein